MKKYVFVDQYGKWVIANEVNMNIDYNCLLPVLRQADTHLHYSVLEYFFAHFLLQ